MAFTYLGLNVVFIVLALGVASLWRRLRLPTLSWWLSLGALLVLTVIFDNLMLWAGFFSYDTTKLIGWYVGLAPIEDFFYAILALLVVPLFWHKFSPKTKKATI